MLTCSTVRKKDSWQNDWSQGFRLCDQEELPCCDTCVKAPYQSHIRYSECGSTSAVPETHYCWVHKCLRMSYMFILQHYLRLLAPCCNPTNHLKQVPQGWVQPSSTQIPQDISYIYDEGAQIHKISLELKLDQPKFCLNGYPGGPSTEDNSHLRWKKSSSYLKEAS